VKFPVIAFNIFPARFPVTVKLIAVVEARVELPETVRLVKNPVTKAEIFPRIFVNVVEARVEEPEIAKFVPEIFVDDRFVCVALVIVPLVELIFVRTIPPADKVVIVAFVIVAFPTISLLTLNVFPERFPVTVKLLAMIEARVELPEVIKLVTFSVPTFDVEAFVVEANKVVRYEVEVANT
jgi:hypothetical protein